MDWTPIYAAVEAVAALSGVSPGAIDWSDQPGAATWGSVPQLRMQIDSVRAYSWDEEERVDPPTPNPGNLQQTVAVVGLREFTLSIRAEVQNSDPQKIALVWLGRLDALLQATSTERDILLPAQLAVVNVHPMVRVANISSNRAVSTYVMDVIMCTVSSEADNAAGAGDYIAQVNITSNKLKSPDGNDAPQQIVLTVGP